MNIGEGNSPSALVPNTLITNILILDTASGAGHVALSIDGKLSAQQPLSTPRRQAEEVFPAIAALLDKQKLPLGEIQALAVSTGPGAFTSLRVGLTAAKSLAEVAGIPLIGISNVAAAARLAPGFPAVIVLPASRGEFFLSVATLPPPDASGQPLPEPALSAVDLVRPEAWLAALESPPRYVLSPSAEFLDFVADRLPGESRCLLISGSWLQQLASLAQDRYRRAAVDDPLFLDAAYARKVDADNSWRDLRLAASPSS